MTKPTVDPAATLDRLRAVAHRIGEKLTDAASLNRVVAVMQHEDFENEHGRPMTPLERLKFANSYTRMQELLNVGYSLKYNAAFWRQVGENWSVCDNIVLHKRDLQRIFATRFESDGFPIFEAMDDKARQFYDVLPERVPLYRGCYAQNRSGFSWSTDRAIAAKFPFVNRYRRAGEQALLVSATVAKNKIAFVAVDRSEAEIIVLSRHLRISAREFLEAAT